MYGGVTYAKSVPCQHDMARPQSADAYRNFQIWKASISEHVMPSAGNLVEQTSFVFNQITAVAIFVSILPWKNNLITLN
jgi:hypothetical protein